MKVYSMSGYRYQPTPAIMLKGQWLKNLGFEIGNYISVSCEDGRIIITPDAERAALMEAETKFMEKEMADRLRRIESEKQKIRAQFVAEKEARYGV